MDRQHVMTTLCAHREALAALGVKHAYLFGSVARDEAGPQSDVDVMIDVAREPFTMFDMMRVSERMEDLLARPVDVVVRADALQKGKKLQHVARDEVLHVF